MAIFQQVDNLKERHHVTWLAVLRMALGVALAVKGIAFLGNISELEAMINASRFKDGAVWLSTYIAYAHLLGGVLIFLGLLTRLAILFQLPILLGAVFFINAPNSMFALQSEFFPSLITLILLLFFFIEGAGAYSLDGYIRKHQL